MIYTCLTVATAVTAGILNAPLIETAGGGMQSINQLAGIEQMGSNLTGNFNAETLGKNLLGIGARGIVNAGVGQAVYGDEAGRFGDAFLSSVVADLAAVGANALGKQAPVHSPQNVLGHAAVGAAAAHLRGQDPLSGAIGGASAAILNPWLDQAIGGEDGAGWGADPATASRAQGMTLQLASMVTGAGIAAAADKDPLVAMGAAHNETVNNYLDHHRPGMLRLSEKERYENAVRDCANGDTAACQTRDVWAAKSSGRDAALAEACSPRGSWMACQSRIQEARNMGNRIGRREGWVYAYSPDSGPTNQLNNTATIGAPSRPENFHDELARNTLDAAIMEGGNIVAGAAFSLAGKALSRLQEWGTTKALGTVRSNGVNSGTVLQGNLAEVWKQPPTVRGTAIESHLAATEYKDWFNIGQLNNGKLPLVDFQTGNTVVSLKSVDTTSSAWMARMQNHIDDLVLNGVTVNGMPANMRLDIRVQPGGLRAAQPLIEYGKRNGVTVSIKEFK